MGKTLALVCAAALACGCATRAPGTPGSGSGASYVPMVDMQGVSPDALASDMAFCRDAAQSVRVLRVKGERDDVTDAIVLGVGIFVPFGLVGMALMSGIAAGLSNEETPKPADASLQQKTLVNCMARKGYRNLDPDVTVAYVPRPSAEQGAGLPRTGRDTYVAESYAKANLCQGSAKATLISKGPGFEHHSVACEDGRRIALRCEFGICTQESLAIALGE